MNMLNAGRILLLDDDTFLIDIYKEKFTDKGCSVQAVHSVDDALRILRGGFIPEAVLFDIEMKGKDGFEFLQVLKDQQLAQGAYFIALTNHSGEGDRKRAMDLGTNAYVVKAEMIPDEVVQITMKALATQNSKTLG